MSFLADAASGLSIESILLNLGLPGVIIIVLGLYARSQINSTEARCQRLEEEKKALYEIFLDQVMPALTKATTTIGDVTALMTETRQREERQAIIEETRRRFEEGPRQ